MPKVTELFDTIGERIRLTAGTQTLFGEPLVVEGRTLIPVAKLRYGFGAGGGEIETKGKDGSEVEHGGGGGGAGVASTPMGSWWSPRRASGSCRCGRPRGKWRWSG